MTASATAFAPKPSLRLKDRSMEVGYTLAGYGTPLLAMIGQSPVVAAPVLQFSPEHLIVRWTPKYFIVAAPHVPVRLSMAGTTPIEFEAQLAGPRTGGDLRLKIVAPSRELGRQIMALGEDLRRGRYIAGPCISDPVSREIIDSNERKHDLLGMLARYSSIGTVYIDAFPIGKARLLSVNQDQVLWAIQGPDVVPPFQIELYGYNSVFILDYSESDCRGRTLVCGFPERITRLRNRNYRRLPAPPCTRVRFTHPLWRDLHIDRDVREISAQGLSFASSSTMDLLYPGLVLHDARLDIGDQTIYFSAEVRPSGGASVDGRQYCGLKIAPTSARDQAAWYDTLDNQFYSTTRRVAPWKSIWELYRKAGYFNLSGKTPEHFDRLAQSFAGTVKTLLRSPELGCHIVWHEAPEESRLQAAMSMLKLYSRSWLVFQLAKISGATESGIPGRTVLRDLHVRCYEHAQRDPNLDWIIGIPQVKPIWSRTVHHDLPERYVKMGRASIVRFRAVEIPSLPTNFTSENHVVVDYATIAERSLLLRAIARTRPTPYREALDLVEDRFGLHEISMSWTLRGLTRRRAVLVAREGGELQAGAVLEMADEGLHLFGLLDSVRLFAVQPGGERMYTALLKAAQGWYRDQEKRSFVAYLEDESNPPPDAIPGATDLGLADFVILSAKHLPELLEHVYEVTAPRRESGMHLRGAGERRGAAA